MTRNLEMAIEVTKTLSPELQEQAARLLLLNAGIPLDDDVRVPLDDEQEAAIAIGLAAAERGDFATDAEVRAIKATYGR